MCKHSMFIKAISVAIFTVAGIVYFSATREAPKPKPDVLDVAVEKCIVGFINVRHIELSERLSACDQMVALYDDKDKLRAVSERARVLYFDGQTRAHKMQAYADYSLIIEEGFGYASAFANRANLEVKLNEDLQAALRDIDQAIELTEDKPRARYFLMRATLLASLYELGIDQTGLSQSLKDLHFVLKSDPDNQHAKELRLWVVHALRQEAREGGGTVRPG